MADLTKLRQEIKAKLTKDPNVVKELEKTGSFSAAEIATLKNGELKFSDQELTQRFNARVLGILGVSSTLGGSIDSSTKKPLDTTSGKKGW